MPVHGRGSLVEHAYYLVVGCMLLCVNVCVGCFCVAVFLLCVYFVCVFYISDDQRTARSTTSVSTSCGHTVKGLLYVGHDAEGTEPKLEIFGWSILRTLVFIQALLISKSSMDTEDAEQRQQLINRATGSGGRNSRRRQVAEEEDGPTFANSLLTCMITSILFVVLIGLLTGAWWVQSSTHRPYIVVLLLASIVPSVALLWYAFYFRNKDCAPTPLVVGSYLAGIFMAFPVALVESLVTEVVFPEHNKSKAVTGDKNVFRMVALTIVVAFGCVAFVEEGGKILYTWYRERVSRGYLTPYGIVIVALAVSLGFASLENAAYIFRPTSRVDDAFQIALARAVMSTPLHGTCGVLIGVGIARRTRGVKQGACLHAIWASVFIHGLYDVVLMLPDALKFIPEAHQDILTRVGFSVSSAVVVFATCWAYNEGRDLLLETIEERPELRAPKWPSSTAMEHASGCA